MSGATKPAMAEPHVVILGGGPAGCGGAYYLHRAGKGQATVVEQQQMLGGNAGSFQENGIWLDFGSHRLHSACDPAILADLQRVLGDDMRLRDRHGRIRLRGHWLHFPLKATDLLLELDKPFAAGVMKDMVTKAVAKRPEGDTFASVLRANLGPTITEHFYFPYARKLWGREPTELSGIQARKRVSAGTFAKLLKRLVKAPGDGKFWYFREGYGQISRSLAAEAQKLGAEFKMGWKAASLEQTPGAAKAWRVTLADRNGATQVLEADHVWSTIPVTLVARMMQPQPPAAVLEATQKIDYRAMILVYLELDVDQFTTTDAHYFPEANVSVTRLSEPKNYFGHGQEPKGRTTLCCELPCSVNDAVWSMSDEQLGQLIVADMERAGLPLQRPPLRGFSPKLRQAYPIYTLGYERWLGIMDDWTNTVPGFLSYGRQGLFAHDNTHHALYMARAAVDCLQGGSFDMGRWNGHYRRIFATHVVED